MIPEMRPTPAPERPLADHRDEYVCWSRMQAEAGQALSEIVARKERERRAGNGTFFWGVGNAPATITSALARTAAPVRAVFSIMKSQPRAVDLSPSSTVVWRRYLDAWGTERSLPAHALVTSRGETQSGAKRAHYALVCYSDDPLILLYGEPFDPAAFRNAGGTGAPVGSSQVTALLRRVQEVQSGALYEANFTAWLTGSYWVRLTDPLRLDRGQNERLAQVSKVQLSDWAEAITEIRGGAQTADGDRDLAGPLI